MSECLSLQLFGSSAMHCSWAIDRNGHCCLAMMTAYLIYGGPIARQSKVNHDKSILR